MRTPPGGFHVLRQLLHNHGAVAATVALTLLTIVMSVIVGIALTPMFIGPVNYGTVALTVLVPAIIAPPILYLAMRLLHELDSAERKLHHISTIDELTRIYNRRYFINTAVVALARAQRYSEDLSLITLDLDHFKWVNDTFGHQAGDLVLIEVVRRAAGCLRAPDTFARYGGEEFMVLLPNTDLEGARTLAERIRTLVEELPINIDHQAIPMTISAGVTTLRSDDRSIDSLFLRADNALYAAKAGGRNRVAVQ